MASSDALTKTYQDAVQTILQRIARRGARPYDEALLREIRGILLELDKDSLAWLNATIPSEYQAGMRASLKTLSQVNPNVAAQAQLIGVHRRAVDVLVDNAYSDIRASNQRVGRHLDDALRRATLQTATDRVAAGTSQAQARRELMKRIMQEGLTPPGGMRPDAYAKLVAVSTVREANNIGRINAGRDYGNDLVQMSTHDSPCPICVVPETLVSGPIAQRGIRRKYSGDVIRIRTASGNSLTGTPDHPILTVGGWRNLKDIAPGDEVISDAGVNRLLAHRGILPNKIQVPTRIDEVFNAFIPPLNLDILTRPSARDFNGNIFNGFTVNDPTYGKVDVVGTDSDLMSEPNIPGLKVFRKDLFMCGVGAIFSFLRQSRLPLGGFAMVAPLPSGSSRLGLSFTPFSVEVGEKSFVRSLGSSLSHFRRQAAHVFSHVMSRRSALNSGPPNVIQGAPVADTESSPDLTQAQPALIGFHKLLRFVRAELGFVCRSLRSVVSDDVPTIAKADTEGGSELLSWLSGAVAADKVLDSTVINFDGHVYDLQTQPNWYVSNGIISHNCAQFEGRVYSVSGQDKQYPALYDTAFSAGYNNVHPHCVVGETLVSGPLATAAVSRCYEGEVVIIRTASGKELTVTPNHPILTPKGWVNAGALNKGDEVAEYIGSERVLLTNPDDVNVKPTIAHVERALGESGGVPPTCVPVAAEHFHGDGIGSEVCVVTPNGFLRDGFNAPLGKPAFEDALLSAHVAFAALLSLSACQKFRFGLSCSPDGIMSRSGQLLALLWRHASEAATHGLTSVTGGHDAALLQSAMYDHLGTAHLLGDVPFGRSGLMQPNHLVNIKLEPLGFVAALLLGCERALKVAEPDTSLFGSVVQSGKADADDGRYLWERLTGQVKLCDVVEIKRREFSGHVYNLESVEGWYAANDIITHNCKHVVSVYLPSLADNPERDRERSNRAFTDDRSMRQKRAYDRAQTLKRRQRDTRRQHERLRAVLGSDAPGLATFASMKARDSEGYRSLVADFRRVSAGG